MGGNTCTITNRTTMPYKFDSDFHVWGECSCGDEWCGSVEFPSCVASGLKWNDTHVTFFADGEPISTFNATCFTQPIGMDFDRETMPGLLPFFVVAGKWWR